MNFLRNKLREAADVLAKNLNAEAPSAAVAGVVDLPPGAGFACPRVLVISFPDEQLRPYTFDFLEANYSGKYMVWNLSTEPYSVPGLDHVLLDCVTCTALPLSKVFEICVSMKNWLDSHAENIAVVHCQQRRSRTYLVLSCFLCMVNKDLRSPQTALEQLGHSLHSVEFPYLEYARHVFAGQMPPSRVLTLRKVIIEEVEVPAASEVEATLEVFVKDEAVCSIQHEVSLNSGLVPLTFELNAVIEGDVYVRFSAGKLLTASFSFHTSFVHELIYRVPRQSIDKQSGLAAPQGTVDLVFTENSEVDNQQEQAYLNSFAKPQEEQKQDTHVEGSHQEEDEEETKIDKALIERYQDKFAEHESSDDDKMDDYIRGLETGHT